MAIKPPYDRKKAAFLLHRLSNKVRKGNGKVFAIGFNKSASTSLHALFVSVGLNSYHGVEWRQHNDIRFLRKYDCFSDGTPRDLAELDGLFPNSKFILNIRDLRGWVYSRLAHIERHKQLKPDYATHSSWDTTEEAIKVWIKRRNEYHLFVLSYFSQRPHDLLVVNFIRDDLAADKVCRFLGYKDKCPKPEKNANPDKRLNQKYVEMLHCAVAELNIPEHELDYDIYCPSLESSGIQSRFPPDSSMIKT